MVIIKINKNFLKVVIIIFIAGFLGFNTFTYLQNTDTTDKQEETTFNTSELTKSSFIAFLASSDIPVGQHKNIEIFDIAEGKVIKKIPLTAEIQKEAENCLNRITGMYVKVKAFPSKGYIIKVPFQSGVTVENEWINNLVNEVFILFPQEEKPYLLVLDSKSRPLFYNFEGDTDKLLEKLNFDPAASQSSVNLSIE